MTLNIITLELYSHCSNLADNIVKNSCVRIMQRYVGEYKF